MKTRTWHIHFILIALAFLTLVPFFFVVNNLFRTNTEFYHSFFSFPNSIKSVLRIAGDTVTGSERTYSIRDEALQHELSRTTVGLKRAWAIVRPYMLNSILVSGLTALGVVFLGSITAYVLARYRFFGSRAVFLIIISTMMFPGVLTLVPSFLLVKKLGLLNTYWAMILPYIAGGQVFAIFVFKSFFI